MTIQKEIHHVQNMLLAFDQKDLHTSSEGGGNNKDLAVDPAVEEDQIN